MKMYSGVILHDHGVNHYAGTTYEAVLAQIADFCREWWDSDGPPELAWPDSDADIVSAYFTHQAEEGDGESYEIEEVEVK